MNTKTTHIEERIIDGNKFIVHTIESLSYQGCWIPLEYVVYYNDKDFHFCGYPYDDTLRKIADENKLIENPDPWAWLVNGGENIFH